MRILSLFANIGVAEAYLSKDGFQVVLANELLERRAKLYSRIYPETEMICGDLTQKNIFDNIICKAKQKNIDIIMATPPCQGMSTAGQQLKNDERNLLVKYVVEVVKKLSPNYVFIENVPLFFDTHIRINNTDVLIPDFIEEQLKKNYIINRYIIDTQNYSVPQMRQRAIVLLSKRSTNFEWTLPQPDDKIITMQDAIGELPTLDPFITDVTEKELLKMFPMYYKRKEEAAAISRWHIPPYHIKRQVVAMQHTPTGCTAFDNLVYYPKKADGSRVKGYHNTYKRQNWNTPAYTITMDNRKISSQNNVHPGRLEKKCKNGENIYSDARTLTLFEIMKLMSLPVDWNVPADVSEAFLRRIIGEGIPPLFVKKTFSVLLNK